VIVQTKDKRQRAPRLGGGRVELASPACVLNAVFERCRVRLSVHHACFEGQAARHSKQHVGARMVGRLVKDLFELPAGPLNFGAIERVQLQPALHRGEIQFELGIGPVSQRVPIDAIDRHTESVSVLLDRLYVLQAGDVRAEQLPDPVNALLEAVVADGQTTPAGAHQIVFRDRHARICDELRQDGGLRGGESDRFPVAEQTAVRRVQLEWAEAMNDRAAHQMHRTRELWAVCEAAKHKRGINLCKGRPGSAEAVPASARRAQIHADRQRFFGDGQKYSCNYLSCAAALFRFGQDERRYGDDEAVTDQPECASRDPCVDTRETRFGSMPPDRRVSHLRHQLTLPSHRFHETSIVMTGMTIAIGETSLGVGRMTVAIN
jgi:hypothetical protein